MTASETFSGEIRVSSSIVDYLSSGLYESPAACLKELVNNSFDADALRVDVFVKPDADRIIVEDDGIGMSRSDFVRHFERISESHKRDESDKTRLGRPKIGKIGIGFIAANEICDTMEIFSTKSGSDDLLHVNINFAKMREPRAKRRRSGTDLAKADYEGEILSTARDSHFTRIFLKNVRGEAKTILAGAHNGGREDSLYGLSREHVVKRLTDPGVKSWSDLDSYSQNMLRVALNVPIRYYPGWIPAIHHKRVMKFEHATERLRFSLFYDGAEQFKPTVFHPPDGRSLLRTFSYSGRAVAAKGYFYVQHGVLRPQDLNGLLVRIRHAAVGGYDPSFMEFPSSEGTLFQRWISAELWADDRLEDALNIDRKTLRIAHPAYVELQQVLHAELSRTIKDARSRLHQARTDERKQAKAAQAAQGLAVFAAENVRPVSPAGATDMIVAWKRAREHPGGQRRLLRKFDVEQLYRIVVEVAREVLDRPQVTRFLRELTRRLTR